MKEIFDWLREEIRSYSCDVDTFSGKVVKSLDTEDALEAITEAEAKWEADCCEWKPHDKAKNVLMVHGELHYRHYVSEWKFCPYCGKRIKIAEVE